MNKLTIGIIGFGRFGQFLAKEMLDSFNIIVTSRTDYTEICSQYNITFIPKLELFVKEKIDIILICTSILSFEKILKKLIEPNILCYIKNKLIIDVCSVKNYPKSLLLQYLPNECDIMCTHPMFGPDSIKNKEDKWNNLKFVYDPIRITNQNNLNQILHFFKNQKCKMIQMSCEQHDEYAANSQFITHLTGRILSELNIQNTPINTNGFQNLLTLVENTENDSFDLFKGLFKYNTSSNEVLNKFKKSFNEIIDELRK